MRILFEIEKLWPTFGTRMRTRITTNLTIVGQNQLPTTLDHPSIKQSFLDVILADHIVIKPFAENSIAIDGRLVLQVR